MTQEQDRIGQLVDALVEQDRGPVILAAFPGVNFSIEWAEAQLSRVAPCLPPAVGLQILGDAELVVMCKEGPAKGKIHVTEKGVQAVKTFRAARLAMRREEIGRLDEL